PGAPPEGAGDPDEPVADCLPLLLDSDRVGGVVELVGGEVSPCVDWRHWRHAPHRGTDESVEPDRSPGEATPGEPGEGLGIGEKAPRHPAMTTWPWQAAMETVLAQGRCHFPKGLSV